MSNLAVLITDRAAPGAAREYLGPARVVEASGRVALVELPEGERVSVPGASVCGRVSAKPRVVLRGGEVAGFFGVTTASGSDASGVEVLGLGAQQLSLERVARASKSSRALWKRWAGSRARARSKKVSTLWSSSLASVEGGMMGSVQIATSTAPTSSSTKGGRPVSIW